MYNFSNLLIYSPNTTDFLHPLSSLRSIFNHLQIGSFPHLLKCNTFACNFETLLNTYLTCLPTIPILPIFTDKYQNYLRRMILTLCRKKRQNTAKTQTPALKHSLQFDVWNRNFSVHMYTDCIRTASRWRRDKERGLMARTRRDMWHRAQALLKPGHTILTSRELMWSYACGWDVRGELTLNSMAQVHTSVTLLTSRDLAWSSGRLTCQHASHISVASHISWDVRYVSSGLQTLPVFPKMEETLIE